MHTTSIADARSDAPAARLHAASDGAAGHRRDDGLRVAGSAPVDVQAALLTRLSRLAAELEGVRQHGGFEDEVDLRLGRIVSALDAVVRRLLHGGAAAATDGPAPAEAEEASPALAAGDMGVAALAARTRDGDDTVPAAQIAALAVGLAYSRLPDDVCVAELLAAADRRTLEEARTGLDRLGDLSPIVLARASDLFVGALGGGILTGRSGTPDLGSREGRPCRKRDRTRMVEGRETVTGRTGDEPARGGDRGDAGGPGRSGREPP